jgi:hypothetical protein
MIRHSLALVLVAATLPLACSKTGDSGSPPAATTAASAVPAVTKPSAATPSAAPPPSATASAAGPPVYAPRKVPAGMLNAMWIQPFEIVRDKGNGGLSYVDAMSRCIGYGKALCTDSEWARACETDPALAKIEPWTASGAGNNRFVTRGGEDSGCRARNIKEGTELSPTRAAVCCDIDIGIKTTAKNDELLTSTVRKVFAYQKAMRDKDSLALAGLYEDKVTWLGKDHTNADIVKVHEESFKKDAAQWTLFDTCTLSADHGSGDGGADVKATADCLTLYQRHGAVVVAMQRLGFGASGKLKLIGDAVTANVPSADGMMVQEKELKERVGILLLAD